MTDIWEEKEVHMVVPGYAALSNEDRAKVDAMMDKIRVQQNAGNGDISFTDLLVETVK